MRSSKKTTINIQNAEDKIMITKLSTEKDKTKNPCKKAMMLTAEASLFC